jgi:hypothetical protein
MNTATTNLASWQRVWRLGLAPQLSAAALNALKKGLVNDDVRLIQGATTSPPPLQCVKDWKLEGGCGVCYAAWQGDGLVTVGEVEEYFGHVCFEAGRRLGEEAGVRYFLNWFDETPRAEMRHLLIPEIDLALAGRGTPVAA